MFQKRTQACSIYLGKITTVVRTARLCAVTAVKKQLFVRTECEQIVKLPAQYIRGSRAVCTSPQVLTLKARLLQASRAVHRRLLSAADAKSQSAWACHTDRLVRTEERTGVYVRTYGMRRSGSFWM